MVIPRGPLGKADAGEGPPVHPDPRIAAFARLCLCIDLGDVRAGMKVIRELRPLGFTIALLKPADREGRR